MVPWKDFNIRDDGHIKDAVKRSNVVFNLIGAERETWNFSFEDVHIDAATRIAQAAAENPLTERFIHVSCIGASPDAASRRLRTKARAPGRPCVKRVLHAQTRRQTQSTNGVGGGGSAGSGTSCTSGAA